MNPFETKEWLEEHQFLIWWSPEKQGLCAEWGLELKLPPAVLAAIQGPQRGMFYGLLVSYGLRVGFTRCRTSLPRSRWHVAVYRLGRYETACAIVLHDQDDPTIAREVPAHGPDDQLCRRCVQALVRYELDRDQRLARIRQP